MHYISCWRKVQDFIYLLFIYFTDGLHYVFNVWKVVLQSKYQNYEVGHEPFLFSLFYLHWLLLDYFYLEQKGGIVNRETISQAEDMGSSPCVGKHPSYWSISE